MSLAHWNVPLHLDLALWSYLWGSRWMNRAKLLCELESGIRLYQVGSFNHERFTINLKRYFDGISGTLILTHSLFMRAYHVLESWNDSSEDRDQTTEIRDDLFCYHAIVPNYGCKLYSNCNNFD